MYVQARFENDIVQNYCMIDLRRLYVLRAVAEYGTVTAAAEAVHLTPSAASHQLSQLGHDLGVTLLEPQGRRIRLTTAARSLLIHADAIAAQWQRAEADLATTRAEPLSGTLRLCGFPTAVATLLAPATSRLQQKAPKLEVHIREAELTDGFNLLFSGDSDVAVVEATPATPPLTDSRFEQQPLLDDPFDLLTSAAHPLARGQNLTLTELAQQPWILGMTGSSARHHVLAACTSAGFTPAIAHEAHTWTAAAALVASGFGIALVPRTAQLPPSANVRRIRLTGPATPSRRILTAIRAGSRDHPAVAAALTILSAISRNATTE